MRCAQSVIESGENSERWCGRARPRGWATGGHEGATGGANGGETGGVHCGAGAGGCGYAGATFDVATPSTADACNTPPTLSTSTASWSEGCMISATTANNTRS